MPATFKQAWFLHNLDLPIPPTKQDASRFLDFVLQGTDSRGQTDRERRALIRTFWKNWVDKRVQITASRHRLAGYYGTVIFLQARTAAEVADIRAKHQVRNPFPFIAVVKIHCRKDTLAFISLKALKRVSVIQQRLF